MDDFRYLEVCRRITMDDLRVAQSAGVPCFPNDYYIYDRYVRMYHEVIATRVNISFFIILFCFCFVYS
jgi:exocyst complex component 3